MTVEPQFKVTVNDDRSWSTSSEFAEYDAAHAVAGALLAGAESVSVERTDESGGPITTPRFRLRDGDLETLAEAGAVERDGFRVVATTDLIKSLQASDGDK